MLKKLACHCHVSGYEWAVRYAPDKPIPKSQSFLSTKDYRTGLNSLGQQDPEKMAQNSASDIVSIYYLYIDAIHDILFNLTTIIPLRPDHLLRYESSVHMIPKKLRQLPVFFKLLIESLVVEEGYEILPCFDVLWKAMGASGK
ncbi:DNA polymerase epsilon catalytic subunit B-like [Bidens hawaiensis]|uniref:DNA polymerase epsilon catalytic subunit B-like n=1 Tax=Bidens hawaiensis TaxID=980011 RepID=UPI00404AD88E